MKLSAAFVTLVLTVLPAFVVGQYGPVVVLNDNLDQPPLKTCNATEKISISNVIKAASTASRRLGGKGSAQRVTSEDVDAFEKEEDTHGRKLTCPSGCGTSCWIGGTGCPGGMGRRNRRTKESHAAASRRARVHTRRAAANMPLATCEGKIQGIQNALDALVPSLSYPCQALLNEPRQITCQEFTMACQIELVSMVNTDANAVVTNNVPVQGTNFCQSDGVSFEAGTEFTVGRVHFLVTGAAGVAVYNRTIAEAPYYFNGENALGPKGVTFPLGTYTMKVTSDYDPLHFKAFVFTVNDC
jgi:hypothetical protein